MVPKQRAPNDSTVPLLEFKSRSLCGIFFIHHNYFIQVIFIRNLLTH